MFAEYQKQVLLTYHEKKALNALSLNLINTTAAKLRAECIAVFTARYDHRHDEKTLKLFFGQRDDAADYLRAITNFKADRFKPLDQFLKGDTTETKEKNIELLAWLINFKPRPYQWDRSYTGPERTQVDEAGQMDPPEKILKAGNSTAETKGSAATVASGLPAGTKIHHPDHSTDAKPGKKISFELVKIISGKSKMSITVMLIPLLFISGAGIYWARNANKGPEQCMCWIKDHYQGISCNDKSANGDVFGMDSLQMVNFRKITRPDTLTQRSLGHIWYSKIDGEVEFYTSGGFHPVHRERKLRPLTIYMLEKYARKNPAGITNN